MINKYPQVILIALLLLNLISSLLFSSFAPFLGMLTLSFSLTLSTYTIYTKHKGAEHVRAKILKDVGVMVLTLILIIFYVIPFACDR
jgi:hypothetical protein